MGRGESIGDVRTYYARILPFYEKESIARAHLAFWRGLARRWRPQRILEIGAGLGRITAELSLHAPAVGIDISLDMLAAAYRNCAGAPRARFVAADMRRVAFGGGFELIVAPSDPLSHLTSVSDRRRALRCVAGELTPGGHFVLDGLYRRGGEIQIPARRIRHADGVLHIEEDWFPVGARDLWNARYRYRERPASGRERTLEASFVARAWDPATIRPFFSSCGLAIEEVWGDFDRRPFRRGASRLIVVAGRRAGQKRFAGAAC